MNGTPDSAGGHAPWNSGGYAKAWTDGGGPQRSTTRTRQSERTTPRASRASTSLQRERRERRAASLIAFVGFDPQPQVADAAGVECPLLVLTGGARRAEG